MNTLRETIQNKITEVTEIDYVGYLDRTRVLEDGKTYFLYDVQKLFRAVNYSGKNIYRFLIHGYVIRNKSNENTLRIIDLASDSLCEKLAEVNIRCSQFGTTNDSKSFYKRIDGYGVLDENGDIQIIY